MPEARHNVSGQVYRCLVCGADEVAFYVVLDQGKTRFSLCKRHRKVYDHVGVPEGHIKHPVKLIAIPS